MTTSVYRSIVERLLSSASIEIDGGNPWDIQVHNHKLFKNIIVKGSLGLGEGYVDGWFDCERIDELIYRSLAAGLQDRAPGINSVLLKAGASIINFQSIGRAFQVGQQHYDIGDDLYEAMLDSRMMYSCAYWKRASTLEAAQEHKLDLIACKLGLQPGMRVLDIGCGWGGAAEYFARKHGVEIVGVTISEHQAALAKIRCRDLDVDVRLQDYRELGPDQFDAVYSIGMFEHVGPKNYRVYMDLVKRVLKDSGRFLLHTIGACDSSNHTDPWINRYIFPNGVIPSQEQIASAIEDVFIIDDWHNFGLDYDRTLMTWFENFDNSYARLREKYNERFYRMWKYYLLSCAGGFRARYIQLWQILLSKKDAQELQDIPVCR